MGQMEEGRYTQRIYLHVFVNVVDGNGVFSVFVWGKKCLWGGAFYCRLIVDA